jgi:AraC-like DNA-binding protein
MSTDAGVRVSRVDLSVGSLDLFRFTNYEHAFPRHAHERFTVGVFDGPNGTISLGGASALATHGAILAVAPDATHSAEPDRERGWNYRSLYPSNELVSVALESSREEVAARFASPVIDDPQIAAELFQVHKLLETSPTTLAVEERLLVVLRALVDRHCSHEKRKSLVSSTMAVDRARAYLDGNFSAQVRLDDLSCECEVSPFHLIRSFRDAIGMTPHAYLMQVRVNRAREMIVAGDAISSVAYRCGFVDQSHLTRTFKRILGVTPGAYNAAGSKRHLA